MNPLLEKLHDIDGLDAISWWPLTWSSWALIAAILILLCLLAYFVVRRVIFNRSWKNDALKKLIKLEKNLTDSTARETTIVLSEYLRRIVLKRFSRQECAGLTGEAWLAWLSRHDPKQFDWEKKGTLLIEVPYAPLNTSLPADQIKNLIQAAKNWVG